MRVMTDFRRMRFGLGVTLMTDSYFAMDIGQFAFTHTISTHFLEDVNVFADTVIGGNVSP